MKKTILLIFTFCFIHNCVSQEKFDETTLIQEYKLLDQKISQTIVRFSEKDTVYGENFLNIKEYHNQNGKVVKKVKTTNSSLGISGERIELYNNSKIIVAVNTDFQGVIWSLIISKYDKEEKLIETMQFDFNRIYKTVFNLADGTKYFDSKGKVISDINMAKRDNPYK